MVLQPGNLEELRQALAAASLRREQVSSVNLTSLGGLVEHTPEDMTATAATGMRLSDLQTALRAKGQWLPLDPPLPERTSLAHLLGWNLSGPRSQGFGLVRDYVIGMKVVLADGQLIRAGGKVVKNVAGYDLCKLFIGARGSLGVIVEVTFKLRPVPEREALLQVGVPTLDHARRLISAMEGPGFHPVILDLHNLPDAGAYTLVVGFEGAIEEVEQQVERAARLGLRARANMMYADDFWSEPEPPGKISVLPSRLMDTLCQLKKARFVTRAGRGIIFYRGCDYQGTVNLPWKLMQQVKAAYDPHNILPLYTACT